MSGSRNFSSIATEILAQQQAVLNSLKVLAELESIEVGTTPFSVIYQEGTLSLNYYAPETISAPPVMIVYALVNRPYILDLQPDRSLIASLLSRGTPVYLLDWGTPSRADRYTDLEDYICYFLDKAVDAVISHSQQHKVNLLGVCQGGTFSLCYTALFPDKVQTLLPLVTPVDFHSADNCLAQLARCMNAKELTDTYGNLPGYILTHAFKTLMPMRLGLQKQLDLPKLLANREKALNFLRMERWINDSPDLCGQAFIEFMQWFFEENRLIEGGLQLGNRTVDLTAITQPVLNIYAQGDHLVPPASASALKDITSSLDYQEAPLPGGHIGVFVGRQAQQHLPDLIVDWLKEKHS